MKGRAGVIPHGLFFLPNGNVLRSKRFITCQPENGLMKLIGLMRVDKTPINSINPYQPYKPKFNGRNSPKAGSRNDKAAL